MARSAKPSIRGFESRPWLFKKHSFVSWFHSGVRRTLELQIIEKNNPVCRGVFIVSIWFVRAIAITTITLMKMLIPWIAHLQRRNWVMRIWAEVGISTAILCYF